MSISAQSKHTVAEIRNLTSSKPNIVFISGIFNIIHPGHTRLFRFAAEQNGIVVIGVTADAISQGAIIGEDDRLQAVRSIEWVDYAFVLHDDVNEFVSELKPEIIVKGREFQSQENPELDILETYGGRLLFNSGESSFSSLDLIRREMHEVNYSTIDKHEAFPNRHGFSTSDLISTLHNFNNLKAIIIGDTIVDEYISCDAVGLSQEDPTVVVRPVAKEVFVGGAGIVSGHASSLGAKVSFFTVLGNDETGKTAASRLNDYNISTNIFYDETRPTTRKKRYRAKSKTLLRVNEFNQQSIDAEIQNKLFQAVEKEIASADVIIFSDFNYGILPQALVDKITASAKKHNVMIVADSQCSSQVGDVSRFKGASLITPTEHEARVATRDTESGLVILAEKLRDMSQAEHVILTLGTEGILINAAKNVTQNNRWITDRLPAMSTAPKDTAGAGDALMVVTALALASGRSIWEAVYMGSLAAACQVGRVGNIPLTIAELSQEL